MSFRIETERLIIREWSESDLAPFLEIASDPEVMRYIGAGIVWTQAQVEEFVGRQRENVTKNGFCVALWSPRPTGNC